ncbi:MAG: hypothetical protein GY811_04100, partial [Myxococcales bacterium]|nr:hypothetical protein [Myxococcales bacterium]
MITFRIDPQGPDHVCLICVTEEREFFIMAGIERTPNVYLKCVAYCECAVAGMDIA